MTLTRRSFFKTLGLGLGLLATRRVWTTAGAEELKAYCREDTHQLGQVVRVVEQHSRYNPWSPTGYCIASVDPEPHFITANKIYS